jgi:hypothetical protein
MGDSDLSPESPLWAVTAKGKTNVCPKSAAIAHRRLACLKNLFLCFATKHPFALITEVISTDITLSILPLACHAIMKISRQSTEVLIGADFGYL